MTDEINKSPIINKKTFSINDFDNSLYDFCFGKLSEEKVKSMNEIILEMPNLKAEVESLKDAAKYCSIINDTKIKKEFVLEILQSSKQKKKMFGNLGPSSWSLSTKILLESVLIIICIALIVKIVPWNEVILRIKLLFSSF